MCGAGAGLPIEFEIDKKLGIKVRQDVLDMTVKKYNEECRSHLSSEPQTLHPELQTLDPKP